MNVPVTVALAALAGSRAAWADPPEHAPAPGYGIPVGRDAWSFRHT